MSFKFGGTPYSFLINRGFTKTWYGNPKGPEIFAGLGYKNIILKASCRYFDQEIKRDLPYRNTYYNLPKGATVRMVFFDLGITYEKELAKRFFIEPSVSYLKNYTSSNIMTFQDEEFNIIDLSGIGIGANIIKYIKLKEYNFPGIYLNLNYNFMNYKKLNSELKNNSVGCSFGVVFKGIDKKKKKIIQDDGYDPTGL